MIKENRMCDCLKQKALSGEGKMNVTAKRIRCTIFHNSLQQTEGNDFLRIVPKLPTAEGNLFTKCSEKIA